MILLIGCTIIMHALGRYFVPRLFQRLGKAETVLAVTWCTTLGAILGFTVAAIIGHLIQNDPRLSDLRLVDFKLIFPLEEGGPYIKERIIEGDAYWQISVNGDPISHEFIRVALGVSVLEQSDNYAATVSSYSLMPIDDNFWLYALVFSFSVDQIVITVPIGTVSLLDAPQTHPL